MTPLLLLLLAAHGHDKKPAPASPTSSAAIEKTIASGQADVQSCYQYATSGGRSLQGKVVMSWFVTPDGEAAKMQLEDASTLQDEGLVQCIEDKLSSWSFPATDKGEQATHTWVFGAPSGAAAAPAKSAPAKSAPKTKERKHKR